MKRRAKRLLSVSLVAACICCAAAFAACNNAKIAEFSVIGEVTVELGSEYHIPAVVAVDENGKEYPAEYVVKQGGNTVETAGDKLTAASTDGYVITYTVTVGKEIRSVETKVNVQDTTAPTVYFKETSVRVPVGEAAALPEYAVQDFSAIAEKTVTAHFLNADEGQPVEGETFTPEEEGFYRIDVAAKDALGNEGSGSAILFAYEENGSDVLADVIEDFSSGYDSSFLYSKEQGQVSISPYIDGDKVSIEANTNGNYWPNINISGETLEKYTAMYGKVLLTVYNAGAFAHQIYYQTGDDAYNRFEIPAGGRGNIEFTSQTIAWHRNKGEDITLVVMNDSANGNNEMFSVYFEEMKGRFSEEQVIYTGDSVQITSLYAGIDKLAGKTATGFEVYYEGEKTTDGVLENSFSPMRKGEYRVHVLFGDDGCAAFDFEARERQMSLNENFEGDVDTSVFTFTGTSMVAGASSFAPEGENALIVSYSAAAHGWPRVEIDWTYLQQFVKQYDYISLTVYNGGQNLHQFYIEKADRKALRRYDVAPQTSAEIRIYKDELQELIDSGYNLCIVTFNDNSPNGKAEDSYFLIDALHGGFSDLNARENEEVKLEHVFGKTVFEMFEDCEIALYDASGEEVAGAVSDQNTVSLPAGEYTAVLTAKKAFYADGRFEASLHVRGANYALSYGFEDGVTGSKYGYDLFSTDFTKTSALISDTAAGASEGTKSLAFDFDGVNDGYPYFVIKNSVLKDFYYLYGEMHFDLYNAGAKTHESYFEYLSGGTVQYLRVNLNPAERLTISLNGEMLAYFAETGKDLEFNIMNEGGTAAYEGARFTVYLDNVRGGN